MHIGSALQIGQESAYAKEMAKHEAHFTRFGPPGRPYEFRAYPTMLYKAVRTPQGGEPRFEGQVAEDDRDRERLERTGFTYGGKIQAFEALERREFELAELAANRATTDQRMSAKAQAEAEAADKATIQHQPVIPEAKDRKR